MRLIILIFLLLMTLATASTIKAPASFSGTFPCADCEGISYHLNLFPNNIFYLTILYLGKEEGKNHFDDIGTYTTKNKTVTLSGGSEAPLFFEMKSRSTLKMLDMNKKPIVSKLNYDLKRDSVFKPVSPRLFMSGMYSYLADAGIFKNCITQQTYSVAPLLDNLELERAYLDTQRTMNGPVMALIEGEIQQRPNMEGNLSTVVVHKFLRLEPNEQCKN